MIFITTRIKDYFIFDIDDTNCEVCGNMSLSLFKRQVFVGLFLLSFIKAGYTFHVKCKSCGHGYDLTDEQALEVKKMIKDKK